MPQKVAKSFTNVLWLNFHVTRSEKFSKMCFRANHFFAFVSAMNTLRNKQHKCKAIYLIIHFVVHSEPNSGQYT